MTYGKSFMVMVRVVILGMILGLLLSVVGCQVAASAGVGSNVYYPDSFKGKALGDPRKPMFAGSGYTDNFGSHGGGRVKQFGGIGGVK